jgi:hypothetical protein
MLMPIDQTEARLHLERIRKFRQQEELIGQLRSASSIVASYFFEWWLEGTSIRGSTPWKS